MVNKQYNIHNPKPSGSPTTGNSPKKQYSPPPMRNIPLISTQPNPSSAPPSAPSSLSLTSLLPSMMSSKTDNLDPIAEEFSANEKQQTVFGRNIKYFNEDTIEYGGERATKNGPGLHSAHSESRDDLTTINGLDRFQYILQMDKEMKGSHPDTLYRIPSRSQNSSTSSMPNMGPNSFSSSVNFWKPDRSSSAASSYNSLRHSSVARLGRTVWRYTKWPLGLLLISGLLGLVVYILVVKLQSTAGVEVEMTTLGPPIESGGMFDDLIGGGEDYTIDLNTNNAIGQETGQSTLPPIINGHAATYRNGPKEVEDLLKTTTSATSSTKSKSQELLAVFIQPFSEDLEIPAKVTTPRLTTRRPPTSTAGETAATVERITEPTLFRSSGSPSSVFTFSDTTPMADTEKDTDPATVIIGVSKPPSKLHQYGFTSGHQNNFGVPIEEDARILRMLDEELIKLEQDRLQNGVSPLTTTTDINFYRTKVSPTLPVLSKFETTTEGLKQNASSEDSVCQSTFLPLCRGVLQYDLTMTSRKKLMEVEYQHFQYLIDSQCSVRVAEFVCSVLEPECRPTQMGMMKPCKRICKAVLEPCAHIIASSEILTSTFDCDSYPDSNDRNVCEDPTRRSKCLNNEFKCFDSSCIPLQWKCDNIKDCTQGEDENECKFCERDEYRCLSNDKCIPDKWRCDQYDDCPDASDELDCFDDESRGFPTAYGNGRVYPFTQELQPGDDKSKEDKSGENKDQPYFTITNDDRLSAEDKTEPYVSQDGDKYISIAAENIASIIRSNSTDGFAKRMDEEHLEIQKSEESGRTLTYPPAKNLNNFQDSKEIMMTSDSETDYKFTSTSTSPMRDTTAHASPCPEGDLRCVDGRCISVDQLCDKVADCMDGSDEVMCDYKN